jgi:hypothetical protein
LIFDNPSIDAAIAVGVASAAAIPEHGDYVRYLVPRRERNRPLELPAAASRGSRGR